MAAGTSSANHDAQQAWRSSTCRAQLAAMLLELQAKFALESQASGRFRRGSSEVPRPSSMRYQPSSAAAAQVWAPPMEHNPLREPRLNEPRTPGRSHNRGGEARPPPTVAHPSSACAQRVRIRPTVDSLQASGLDEPWTLDRSYSHGFLGDVAGTSFTASQSGSASAWGIRPKTLMVHNLPSDIGLHELLEHWPLDGSYDFLYLLMSIAETRSAGFAFINFVSGEHAASFSARWHSTRLAMGSRCRKLKVSEAQIQGLEANVQMTKAKWRPHQSGPIIVKGGRIVTLHEC